MCRNFHHSKDLDPHQDLGAMYSRSDLKWFSSDDEADAVAAGDTGMALHSNRQ